MIFVSQLMGIPVIARNGDEIGVLHDIVVYINEHHYPPVGGFVVRDRRRRIFIPAQQLGALSYQAIEIDTTRISLDMFVRRDGEVLLNKDVIDHQIIDINGRRIVRVNDVQMSVFDGVYRVVGVDVSPQALVRRILPRRYGQHFVGRQVISWADAQYLASAAPVQLKVSYTRLQEMSAVDLARIVDALSFRESAEIVAALDDETAAETLEEVSDERSADLLETMDQERAADILEEMTPSAAADLLEDLDDTLAAQLLARMEPEEAEDVKELLAYDGDSVGRLMMTDVVTAFPDDTVAMVIAGLKARSELPDQLTELFVVERPDEQHDEPGFTLMGLVRVDQLLLADPALPMSELVTDVPTVHPDEPAVQAARLLGEYNLTAVPVIDDAGWLVGAISVDDALAVLLPDIWQRRGARNFG